MRIALLVSSLIITTTALADDQAVFRCEGKDGRITYSDSACPSTSRSARKVDDGPTLTIPATKDAKDAPRSAREAGAIAQGRSQARFDPYSENRRLDEQIEAQKRECDDLGRRLNYATRDLEMAGNGQRASAELALRRAQDQYKSQCVRR
jgi:hypothetical protein